MIKKVAFTMYPVVDLARARDFYENTLGIKVTNVYEHERGSWIEYDLPQGGCFAITTVMEGVTPSASGGCLAFEVEDLDAMLVDLRSKNIKIVMDKLITPGVCSIAVILDSEGNGIALHQLKRK